MSVRCTPFTRTKSWKVAWPVGLNRLAWVWLLLGVWLLLEVWLLDELFEGRLGGWIGGILEGFPPTTVDMTGNFQMVRVHFPWSLPLHHPPHPNLATHNIISRPFRVSSPLTPFHPHPIPFPTTMSLIKFLSACRDGHLEEAKSYVDTIGGRTEPALRRGVLIAVRNAHLDVATWVCARAGVKPTQNELYGVLRQAVPAGHTEVVKWAIEHYSSDVLAPMIARRPFIRTACTLGRLEIAKRLLFHPKYTNVRYVDFRWMHEVHFVDIIRYNGHFHILKWMADAVYIKLRGTIWYNKHMARRHWAILRCATRCLVAYYVSRERLARPGGLTALEAKRDFETASGRRVGDGTGLG